MCKSTIWKQHNYFSYVRASMICGAAKHIKQAQIEVNKKRGKLAKHSFKQIFVLT